MLATLPTPSRPRPDSFQPSALRPASLADYAVETAVAAVVAGLVLPDVMRTIRRVLPAGSGPLLTWAALGGLVLLPLLNQHRRRLIRPLRPDGESVGASRAKAGWFPMPAPVADRPLPISRERPP